MHLFRKSDNDVKYITSSFFSIIETGTRFSIVKIGVHCTEKNIVWLWLNDEKRNRLGQKRVKNRSSNANNNNESKHYSFLFSKKTLVIYCVNSRMKYFVDRKNIHKHSWWHFHLAFILLTSAMSHQFRLLHLQINWHFFVRSIISYNKPLLRKHTDLPEIGKQKVNQSKWQIGWMIETARE